MEGWRKEGTDRPRGDGTVGQVDGGMEGQTDGRTDGHTNGWKERERRADKRTNKRIGGWEDQNSQYVIASTIP
jgi:hypothetical protein